ncbi:lytic transglycosylase domain-containing protein [Candidatus Parabeggiatoa sp. HSG14]|uniref:lytic transglycosylase domain-containing protein n=1 Tax=Candidatus Parabeggiatoa sp. HSG14 TaxID=3055593 RepID=UPI0025A92942|nr:lytic transglycosylase domain-containing protein [Thiotrichales bacterium HSG14]
MKQIKSYSITFIIGAIAGATFLFCVQTYTKLFSKSYLVLGEYQDIAWEIARQHKLEFSLLSAIVQQESAWNPKAVSPKGAIGLMQIMPATALGFCGLSKEQLFEPRQNLECGTAYFAHQLKKFGTVKLALCAYNAGPTRVRRLGRCPRFKETTLYTSKILKNWKGNYE